MAVSLTDVEIMQLLTERKQLPPDYRAAIQVKPKRGHKERELEVKGDGGNSFRLVIRQSILDPLDFSVILIYRPAESNQLFRLRRHNGRSHEHTNTLEGETFYDFHIHMATERYQDSGLREDSYAEPTGRFVDLGSAITCMLKDCGFSSSDMQTTIFDEEATP
ncbi:MAG: hypothetical protein KKA32_06515 [Actinobacteria bacterium]|nr:hypothetical protein [Actinomycetota bacterium]